jgi:hypothetical protein
LALRGLEAALSALGFTARSRPLDRGDACPPIAAAPFAKPAIGATSDDPFQASKSASAAAGPRDRDEKRAGGARAATTSAQISFVRRSPLLLRARGAGQATIESMRSRTQHIALARAKSRKRLRERFVRRAI